MCSAEKSSAMMKRFALTALAIVIAGSASIAANVEEPSSYRMGEEYRAPMPATLKGARVVSTEEAEKLWRVGESKSPSTCCRGRRSRSCRKERSGASRHTSTSPAASGWPMSVSVVVILGDGDLVSRQPQGADGGRRSLPLARHLLSRRLLDVLERRQTRRCLGLFETVVLIPAASKTGRRQNSHWRSVSRDARASSPS